MPLKIDFDPDKDATNLRVHGVSLTEADALFRGFTVQQEDDRFDYGETRFIAIGEIAGVEFTCVYTLRGEAYRLISLRRASRRERNVYQAAKTANRSEAT
ncbi:MAG: BrnT family toxin [Alphaproteobacteria bacterium]|nr:BrnT family toxin [Alphaproteobacteria bacterium]